jgi:phage-related baseplate assembly protein
MSLQNIDFVETDTETIKAEIIAEYERISARSLARADPVRLFLESIASVIAHQRTLIDYTGKMNLLLYSRGDYLDHIGVLVGARRIQAAPATAQFKIMLSAARQHAVTVPKGTRINASGDVFFAIDRDVIILAGATEATAAGTCTSKGTSGNGYAAGEIKTIVDPIPYVQAITNITASDGGADEEDDEAFRTRIQEAPEHFSVAGPAAAYAYFAKSASALIADVAVTTPKPGEVNIYPLLQKGVLPGDEVLREVRDVLKADDIRPLTDKIEVFAPVTTSYNIELSYYIDAADTAREASIKSAVERSIEEYIIWQRSKIGRDINPTELQYRIRAAGAKRAVVTTPSFAAVADTAIAVVGTKEITYGGIEHG